MQRPRNRNFVLPEFATGCIPSVSAARYDQLQIQFQGCQVRAPSLGVLYSYLGQVARGGLLQRQGARNGLRLKVRPGWLFSGEIKFFEPRGSEWQRFNVTLRLNPTRFQAHNPPALAAPSLGVNAVIRERLSSATLDGQDNFLPPENYLYYGRFHARTLDYFRLVCGEIEQALQPDGRDPWATETSSSPVDFLFDWSRWVISHAEVYWEFQHRDALALMHQLRPELHALANEASINVFPGAARSSRRRLAVARESTDRNAIAVQLNLGTQGIDAILYAKAHDRLRLEVRFGRNLRQLLPRASTANFAVNEEGLDGLLRHAVEETLPRVSRLMNRIANRANSTGNRWVFFSDLMRAVFYSVENDVQAGSRLMSMLLASQAITATGEPVIDRAIQYLVQRGVLSRPRLARRERTRRYVLEGRYRDAIRELSSLLIRRPN